MRTKDTPVAPGLPSRAEAGARHRARLLATKEWLTQTQVDASLKGFQRGQTAEDLRCARQLIAVLVEGIYLYPSVQLDLTTGRPRPAMIELLSIIPSDTTAWETVNWLFQRRKTLQGGCPADFLATQPDLALQAARDDFQPPLSSW